jgi:hypothetical protein
MERAFILIKGFGHFRTYIYRYVFELALSWRKKISVSGNKINLFFRTLQNGRLQYFSIIASAGELFYKGKSSSERKITWQSKRNTTAAINRTTFKMKTDSFFMIFFRRMKNIFADLCFVNDFINYHCS